MKTYTMLIFFSGKGEPIGHAEGFVSSKARGRIITAASEVELPPQGVLQSEGDEASFDTVVFARDGRFWEAGRVDFPKLKSHLDVRTVNPGVSETRPDGSSFGSISWQVSGGGGFFAGATGVVTGNFTAAADGQFRDHQLYKIFLPD
jgi:hypothetical protein